MSEAKPEAAAAAAPKKSRSKLLTLGLPVVVLLLAGGGGGWWYFARPAAAAEAPVKETPPGLLPFDPFVVNLADPGGRKFVRVSAILLLPSQKDAAALEEDLLVISRIRSAVLELLASKTSLDLATPEGRAKLRQDIGATAATAGQVEVKDVLFQEFIVQ